MRVHDFRACKAKELVEGIGKPFKIWLAYLMALETKLNLRRVFSDFRGFILLICTYFCHFCVRNVLKRASAGRASPISHCASRKMLVCVLVTRQNAINGHDFDVILMRAHSKVSCLRQSYQGVFMVGDVNSF